MIQHYITKYAEAGHAYAEAWMQFNVFGHCICFWRKRIQL